MLTFSDTTIRGYDAFAVELEAHGLMLGPWTPQHEDSDDLDAEAPEDVTIYQAPIYDNTLLLGYAAYNVGEDTVEVQDLGCQALDLALTAHRDLTPAQQQLILAYQ